MTEKTKKVTSVLLSIVIALSTCVGWSTCAYAGSTIVKDITKPISSNTVGIRVNIDYDTTLRIIFISDVEGSVEYEYLNTYTECGGHGASKDNIKEYKKDITVHAMDYLDIYFYFKYDIPDSFFNLKIIDLSGKHKDSMNFKVGQPMHISYLNDENDNCKWSSSNKKVATVSSDGLVNPKNLGQCTINCKNREGKITKYKIKVVEKNIYVFAGSKKTLPKIEGKTNKKWKNSKKDIVSLTSKDVKGKKQGVAQLTCKHKGVKYTTNIYVVDNKKLCNDTIKKIKKIELVPNSVVVTNKSKGYDELIYLDDNNNQCFGISKKIYPTVYITYKAKNKYDKYEYFTVSGMYKYDRTKKKYIFMFENYVTKLKENYLYF